MCDIKCGLGGSKAAGGTEGGDTQVGGKVGQDGMQELGLGLEECWTRKIWVGRVNE